MGTTVTTNLGLIKPDGNESIKENLPTFPGWAAQNTINCDKIDALFRATTTTPAAPTFATTGGAVTFGAGGGAVGKYLRVYPGMVISHFTVNMGGAGFAAVAGVFTLTAPLAMHADLLTFATWVPIGRAILQRNSAVANSSVLQVFYDIGTNLIVFRTPDSQAWSTTAPFAIGQSDKISGYAMYPTSVA